MKAMESIGIGDPVIYNVDKRNSSDESATGNVIGKSVNAACPAIMTSSSSRKLGSTRMRSGKILTREVGRASERAIGNRCVDVNSIALAQRAG